MRIDTTLPGLLDLMTQQYDEANEALSPRLPRWKYLLDQWRGVFRERGYYKSLGYDKFYSDLGFNDGDEKYENQSFRVFVREIFRDVETLLSRFDRAFLSNPRPIQIIPPRVFTSPPPPNLGTQLDGLGQWLNYDYRVHALPEEQLKALRDCLLVDIGYTLHRRADKDEPYPRALIERFYPWEGLPDPLACRIQVARYFLLRHWYSKGEAIARWPDSKEEILQVAEQARTATGRKEVRVYHYWSWLDPKLMGDRLLDDSDLQDMGSPALMELWFLGTEAGPTEYLLDAYPCAFSQIPVQDYTILTDPEERGPYGMSMAYTCLDDQEAVNELFNNQIEAFQYATLQGGFIDAAYAGGMEEALLQTPRPGEWKVAPFATGDIAKALMPLKYANYTKDYMAMLAQVRVEPARKWGITDQNQGISTPTQTNTLGEVSLLQGESNELFRFRAQRLDVPFLRSYRLHVEVAGKALKSWQVKTGQSLIFRDPQTDEMIPLQPEAFDQPWEVELRTGSTFVDGPRKAQKMLQYAGLSAQTGSPVPVALALRKAMELDGLDPDEVLGPPGAAPAVAPPPAAPGPGGLPVSADPGLATKAALAGQGVIVGP